MFGNTKIILAIVLLIKSLCYGGHDDKTNGDVIVTYSGHVDVLNNPAGGAANEVKETVSEATVVVDKALASDVVAYPAETPEDKGCTCGSSTRLITVASTESSKPTSRTTEPIFTIKLSSIEPLGTPVSSRRSGSDTIVGHGAVSEAPEEVVFIPNVKEEPSDDDDYLNHAEKSVGDLFVSGRTLDDLIRGNEKFNMEPERSNSDHLFITGKYNDEAETEEPYHHKDADGRRSMTGTTAKPVDCDALDCNNKKAMPVCGAKLEQNKWKYRSFLNECFFNKVNCGFNHQPNKYIKVDNYKCVKVSRNRTPPPQYYVPVPPKKTNGRGGDSTEQFQETRRVFQSRRSSSLDLNGRYCSHMCPVACPKVYEPECAISSLGQKRVFENHCKLDFNSCQYNLMWQTRPLAECVGQEAAEVRQNRAFIAWMQNIGIIDNKGRFNKA